MKPDESFAAIARYSYYRNMSLTKGDLLAIKKLFDNSFDERVPQIIDERIPQIIDERVPRIIEMYIDDLKLEIGQFSLETTKRINALDMKLSGKIDDLSDRLVETREMANTNRVEIVKIKRKLKMA